MDFRLVIWTQEATNAMRSKRPLCSNHRRSDIRFDSPHLLSATTSSKTCLCFASAPQCCIVEELDLAHVGYALSVMKKSSNILYTCLLHAYSHEYLGRTYTRVCIYVDDSMHPMHSCMSLCCLCAIIRPTACQKEPQVER